MGPIAHVYLPEDLSEDERLFFGDRLIRKAGIPTVASVNEKGKVEVWTEKGYFSVEESPQEIFGPEHPFLEELLQDFRRLCCHESAGDYVLFGWSPGQPTITFPIENGSHAGFGLEETHAFAFLPKDAPIPRSSRKYLRPLDLRKGVMEYRSGSRASGHAMHPGAIET